MGGGGKARRSGEGMARDRLRATQPCRGDRYAAATPWQAGEKQAGTWKTVGRRRKGAAAVREQGKQRWLCLKQRWAGGRAGGRRAAAGGRIDGFRERTQEEDNQAGKYASPQPTCEPTYPAHPPTTLPFSLPPPHLPTTTLLSSSLAACLLLFSMYWHSICAMACLGTCLL